MSKTNAIKAFRDLLSFLTVIPLGKTEDFVVTSAEFMFLFPLAGAFIGLLGAAYFLACGFILSYLLAFVNSIILIPVKFLLKLATAIMTVAFLLILTGLQHFDGLVDLGNALGLGSLEKRRAAAHAWTVTYRGAILAIFVEFLMVLGLFFLSLDFFAFQAIVASEVGAKLAMVTIARIGKPTHKGLGSRFLESAKKKRNLLAYLIAVLIVFPLFGFTVFGLVLSCGVILVSVLLGASMERVANAVFGGVSGDMIGATNEVVRAASLIFVAGVLMT